MISSNLDKCGIGDIWMLIVNEYKVVFRWIKFVYRFYRNLFVMFIFGLIYVFLIINCFNKKGVRCKECVNIYFMNLVIVVLVVVCCLIFGW